MKNPLILILALAAFLVSPAPAADPIPDLKGKWVSEYPVHFHHGTGSSKQTLIFESQKGEGFRGVREWTRTDFTPAKKDGAAPKKKVDQVAFAGVVGFDGKTLHFADHGQITHIQAKLTSADEMQVVFVMPGDPAVAFRATFKRVKS